MTLNEIMKNKYSFIALKLHVWFDKIKQLRNSIQPWIKWFINTSFIHFSKTVNSVFIQVNWSSGSPVQSPHSETMYHL